ncbi:hypothetical protein V1477_018442 [Vespula maculifrons]|uniref:Uncharacterized protein n=1 Tax=Vespula maculifrons TaxID=7453 RepID=A0ABD2AW17_VESMC
MITYWLWRLHEGGQSDKTFYQAPSYQSYFGNRHIMFHKLTASVVDLSWSINVVGKRRRRSGGEGGGEGDERSTIER